MNQDIRGLNVPFPPKNHWRAQALVAVVLFAIPLYGVSENYGKAYIAALLAFLPGLALFNLGGGILKRLQSTGDPGKIVFWSLVAAYLFFAKSLLFPFAIELVDRVFA